MRKLKKHKNDSKIGFINNSEYISSNNSVVDENSVDLRVDYITKEDFINEIQAEINGNSDNKSLIGMRKLEF